MKTTLLDPPCSHEELLDLLNYDPLSGLFTRRKQIGNQRVGTVAGSRRPDGYGIICIKGRYCYTHRLAWFYVHGEWPTQTIDHVRGWEHGDGIDNLRQVTHAANIQNRVRLPRNNRSGFLGVSYSTRDRMWKAFITVNYRKRALGSFPTPEAAAEAYNQAKAELHAA